MPLEWSNTWQGSHIIDSLFLTDFDAALLAEAIEYYECRSILTLLNALECRCVDQPGIIEKYKLNWLWIEYEDSFMEKGSFQSTLHKCADFIHQSIDVKQEVCFVHCWAGVSRSSTVVIGYLMKYRDMDAIQAYQFVRQQRPRARPNPAFIVELKLFNENKSKEYIPISDNEKQNVDSDTTQNETDSGPTPRTTKCCVPSCNVL